MKMTKRKMKAGIVVAVVCFAAVGAVCFSQWNKAEETEIVYKETTVNKGNLTVGVTESGSVSIATLEQGLDFLSTSASGSTQISGQAGGTASQSSSAELVVEEVYAAVGQRVEKDAPLLKFTQESVAAYRKELSDAAESAAAEVNAAKLSAEKQKLSAEYAYSLSQAKGSVAQGNYQAELEELEEALSEAQEAVDESAAYLRYYQEQIDAGVDLSESLAKEQENYDKLSSKLKTAQSNYTTKSIEAEAAYKEALFSQENAGAQYEVDVSGAESEVDSAGETLQEAQEALAEFDESIKDGTVYAEYAGTIAEFGYEAGDTVSAETNVAVYADADAVTMTVSVSQEDISGIAVGDKVHIALTAYENEIFEGVVQGMDTSVSSGSSVVSYDVTVLFTGDVTKVYTDMTGNVTFIEKEVEDVLYISNKAVINEGVESYVKVKNEDGTVEKILVETGFSDGVNVEIKSGISEGMTVLIEGTVSETS